MTLPNYLYQNYPFENHYWKTLDGHRYHYIDEGPKDKDPIIMVHGNPTWSFFYRNLIKELSKSRRVIAVDHIGCGLSEKPQDYDYTLENHIKNLDGLLSALFQSRKNQKSFIDLIVHDWGGAIGMGFATRHPDWIRKSVIMNTAAFTDINIPKRIGVCKLPIVGEKLVRYFNAFAWPATFMAVRKPMANDIKKSYLYPYNNYKNRIATARFVKDIPMGQDHPTWNTLKEVENNLSKITGPKLLLWGEKDFCFSPHFFKRWQKIFPENTSVMLKDAGHYLLEDEPEKTQMHITEFLQ